MKIILNEDKMNVLLSQMMLNEVNTFDGNARRNPYSKKIEIAKTALEKLLNTNGNLMVNIENGKDYITYELYSLSDTLGKRYCICRLMKDGNPYGMMSIKPLELFKIKNF